MEKDNFDDFKRELKQRNDIVSVASKYVQLERKGRYYWCRCPFHGEKTPSLCINEADGFFYCYGCHTGGNVINFVMKIESISYYESLKLLASWANIDLPKTFEFSKRGVDIETEKKRKDRLLALMKDAAIHYHENLNKQSARAANFYMDKRQLSGGVAKHFAIGYADGYYDLPNYLKSIGYTSEEMLAVGVVKKKDSKEYDPLANRLIFPIIDIYGNVIAFGGRTLETHPEFAKYLNTAETEIFNKRNTLYAINYLKKQRQQGPIPYVIVVEGYMDTIALHKVGFTMTVASMGTSLTQNQAKMIKRFADKVYICYDGDAAGQNATLRGLDILRENGLDVMVVQLPDKFDPDDVIKAYGKEGYQKILDEALPLVEFKLSFIKSKYNVNNVDERVKYLNEAVEVLASLSNVEREIYSPIVSEIADANNDFIKVLVDKINNGKSVLYEIETKLNPNKDNVVVKAEKYILYSLIHKKPYAHFKTNVSYLFSGVRRDIYNQISNIISENNNVNIIDELYDNYNGEDSTVIVDIINYSAESADDEHSEKKYYYDCLWMVYKNYLETMQKELSDEYAAEVDNLKRQDLANQIKDISNKLKSKKVEEL